MIESQLKNLIYVEDLSKVLNEQFCNHIINRFENDDRKIQGSSTSGNIDLRIKVSQDLHISYFDDWSAEQMRMDGILQQFARNYEDNIKSEVNKKLSFRGSSKVIKDSGFQIQKTPPHGFYDWHDDSYMYSYFDRSLKQSIVHQRVLTYIFYLNDVEEDGYTEFIDGTRIQPQRGKAIMFPATWSYLHRGYPPKTDKYIMTGWISRVTRFSGTLEKSSEVDYVPPSHKFNQPPLR